MQSCCVSHPVFLCLDDSSDVAILHILLQETESMDVTEVEDAWSCPTGLLPINATPSHVDYLPALPGRDLRARPDMHLSRSSMVLNKSKPGSRPRL